MTKPQTVKRHALGKSAATIEAERKAGVFVQAYGRTGNARVAAVDAGYSAKTANQAGARLLADPAIYQKAAAAREQFLAEQEDVKKRQRRLLEAQADDAIEALGRVVSGQIKVGAATVVSAAIAILDRAGHKPVSEVDHRSSDGTMRPLTAVQVIVQGE